MKTVNTKQFKFAISGKNQGSTKVCQICGRKFKSKFDERSHKNRSHN